MKQPANDLAVILSMVSHRRYIPRIVHGSKRRAERLLLLENWL